MFVCYPSAPPQEISERREFLESMRALGKGEQYEPQIRAEISARMFELKQLGQDIAPGRPGAAAAAQGAAKGISAIGLGPHQMRR